MVYVKSLFVYTTQAIVYSRHLAYLYTGRRSPGITRNGGIDLLSRWYMKQVKLDWAAELRNVPKVIAVEQLESIFFERRKKLA